MPSEPIEIALPMVFCDVEVPLALGAGLSQWDGQAISWRDMGITYPNADFGKAMRYTIGLIEKHCGLHIEIRTNNRANLESHYKRIDGPQGVLARQYLPGTPGPLTQSRSGEWDSGERNWLTQPYLDVITCHEISHGIGVGHYDGAPSLMNRQINIEMHGKVDVWTVDEWQLRYGPPRTTEDPGEPPGPTPFPDFDWVHFYREVARKMLELLPEEKG